jgi:excisionase family DNA binding protein
MEETQDYRAAAKVTGLPTGALRALVCRKQIPRYRIGKRIVRFRQSELEQWLQARHVAPQRSLGQGGGAPIEKRPVDAAPDAGGSR